MRVLSAAFVVILLVVGIVSCGESEEERSRKAKVVAAKAAESQMEAVVKGLVEKHDALTNWDRNTILYTIQLQELLVNSEKPILFRGYVSDIFQRDGQCYIHLVKKRILTILDFDKVEDPISLIELIDETDIHFILKCHSDKVTPIIAMVKSKREDTLSALWRFKQDTAAYYAVVAKISNVSKPDLRIAGLSASSGEVELQYKPSQTFIAVGECIDLTYIGGAGDVLF